MVTMREIDDLRERAVKCINEIREVESVPNWEATKRREELKNLRTKIDGMLREWWAQGCREAPGPLPAGCDTRVSCGVCGMTFATLAEANAHTARKDGVGACPERVIQRLREAAQERAEQAEAALAAEKKHLDDMRRVDACLRAANNRLLADREAAEGQVSRLTAILNALVSDASDSAFDDEIVEWRRRVIETYKHNAAPDPRIGRGKDLAERIDDVRRRLREDGRSLEHDAYLRRLHGHLTAAVREFRQEPAGIDSGAPEVQEAPQSAAPPYPTRTEIDVKIDEKIRRWANDPNSVFVGHLRCK